MSADTLPCDGDRLRALPSSGLGGDIVVPGDKSMSHRALILGALAQGETWIDGLLEGQDVIHTAAALRAFGAGVERAARNRWRVSGAVWQSPRAAIDCGNSGTGARLLMGAAAGFPIEATFTGDASLRGRPMSRVLDPLREMGARAGGSTLPVTIHGGGLGGISFVNEKASAQVKSAILLAGLHSDGVVEVIEPLRSRDHSEKMLAAFGCDVEVDGNIVRLGERRSLTGTIVRIPGDPSSAAFPIVAALISPGSDLMVRSVLVNPLRAGLFDTLAEMGAKIELRGRHRSGGEEIADIRALYGPLHGVEAPASRVPSMIDEFPILAVAAACARGRTIFNGLAELRVKESDRLAAIVSGLRRCGVSAQEEGDRLIIDGCDGAPPGGAFVAGEHDHRIAMSFLVLGLASQQPVEVDSGLMIGTSFPGFADLMRSIGARIG